MRNGMICGQKCIGTICSKHAHCAHQIACQICGKGTQSASGFCTTPGPCKRAQHATMSRASRTAGQAPARAVSTALDDLVDELLADFIPV